MTEFTSLTCPNCGGALKAEIGARALRCSYCGTQHAIKDDLGVIAIIPEAAACPVCGKSDRVGSLPIILAHPTEGERATGLPKRLTMLPPQYHPAAEPERGSEVGNIKMPGDDLFWGSLALIAISFGYMFFMIFVKRPEPGADFTAFFLPFPCFIGVGGWFWWFSIYFLNSDRQARQAEVNRQRQLAREYPEKLKRYQRELEQNQKIKKSYQAARDIWPRLYYCGRDDCIYLPGEDAHAKPDQMVELIKQKMRQTQF